MMFRVFLLFCSMIFYSWPSCGLGLGVKNVRHTFPAPRFPTSVGNLPLMLSQAKFSTHSNLNRIVLVIASLQVYYVACLFFMIKPQIDDKSLS